MSVQAAPRLSTDAAGELSWRIYLLAMALGFFVAFEPAPTDAVFMLAVGAFFLSRPTRVQFLSGTALVGILLYCFFSILSLLYVVYVPMLAVRAVLIEFYMIGLFVMTGYFTKVRGDHAFSSILLAFTFGGIMASFVTIAALLNLFPNPEAVYRGDGTDNVRVKATFKDPNVFGPYLVPCLLFVIWVIIESPRWRKLAYVVLALLLVSLFSTYSRGAWVHFVISLSVFSTVLLVYRDTARPVFTAVVWLIIAALIIVLFFLDPISARLSDTFFARRLSLQSYDESRFAYILEAAEQIWQNPFGIGPYQSRYKYGYLPHNTFIAFAMHNGFLASMGLFLIYCASMVRCGAKVLAQRPGWVKYALILSVLTGLLVLMQVVGSVHWRHLYIICGMAFGTYTSNQLLPDYLLRRRPRFGSRRASPAAVRLGRPSEPHA
jgi:hypothetical protein